MAESRRNTLVGVFVLLGLAALGALIVLFGKGPTWLMRGSTYSLVIRFDEATGIRPGNQVTVQGINVGRVIAVDVVDPADFEAGVSVVVAIEHKYQIPVGSRAQTSEPVLGQGRPPIELLVGPASGQFLKPGGAIDGTIRSAMDSIFPSGVVDTFQTTARQIGDAAEAMTPVLDELKGLLEARRPADVDQPGGPMGNLTTAVARLDAGLRHFNEVLGDETVKSQLRATVANLNTMSEKGTRVMADLEAAAGDSREVMADARRLAVKVEQTLDNADAEVRAVSVAVRNSLEHADEFLGYLNTVGQQVARGEGTIGRLVMDSRLYEALAISVERLTLALEDFRGLIEDWRKGRVRIAL